MRNAVSPKTFEIISGKGRKAADPQSTGLTRAKIRKVMRRLERRPDPIDQVAAIAADEAVIAKALRDGSIVDGAGKRPRRATRRAGKANVVAVLELAGGALQLATVSQAYGKAMTAAGKGQVPSIPPAAIDAGVALLALLRRYRAKR